MLYDPDTKNFLIFLKKVLQNTKTYDIISKSRETRLLAGQRKKVATVAQSVERRIGSAEVTGPIPVSSCKNPCVCKGFFFYQKCPVQNRAKFPSAAVTVID